jgi:hypothetical protein
VADRPAAQTAPTPNDSGDDGIAPEFSCLRHAPHLDCWIFELESSPGLREPYLVRLGSCDNPACDCRALEVWMRPLEHSGPPSHVTHLRLLFETREVERTVPEGPRDRQIAETLAKRLNADDWFLAQEIYAFEKAEISEPQDASDLQVSFPEDVLSDPSTLIQYQDLFPYARLSHFQLASQFFVVFERYCSHPECTCTEVCLDIAATPPLRPLDRPTPPHVTTEKDVTRLLIDYRTDQVKVAKPGPPGSPPAAKLFQALQSAGPDLKARLERRHRVLQQLHKQARTGRVQTAAPQPFRTPKKVGRNEPCPCGSGKKFKHCCGR